MNLRNTHWRLWAHLILTAAVLSGCAGSTHKFRQEYARVWQETIKSDAWKASLSGIKDSGIQEDQGFYSSTEEIILETAPNTRLKGFFSGRYDQLVAAAYYKIISEAEMADRELKEEHQRLNAEHGKMALGTIKKGNLAKATKKYEAHSAMLSGLKSWNIMSEYGSDDLDFFKAEHKTKVALMFEAAQSEEEIINYLVYKLADLYHFDQ